MEEKLIIEPIPKDADLRLCVCVFDNDGKLVQRTYGLSPMEQQDMHNAHRCDWLCPLCYDEAMRTICTKDPGMCRDIPPGSCGPDCYGFESKYDEKEKVICQICGRQIVSYTVDNDRCIGPASDGCLRLVEGYACPPCSKEEKKLEDQGYYN